MGSDLATLARELTALTQRFADLGAKLGNAARALEDTGAPPGDVLVDDLAGARTRFLALRTDVLSAAEAASVPPNVEPESLTELEPLLEAIEAAVRLRAKAAALEESRQRILGTLDRVLEIVHREDPAFASLVGCHEEARTLREQAMALDDPEAPEAQKLIASAQTFDDLLMMIDSRDGLDDELYAQLEETVSKVFGRSLAVAVARGKLGFAGEIVETPPTVEPPLTAEPVLPAPVPPADALEVLAELDTPPLLTPPPVDEPPVELSIEPPPAPPEPRSFTDEMPTVEMPTIEMPRRDLEAGQSPTPAPPVMPPPLAPQPVASPPRPVAPAEPSAPDETAQWWLAAWARWSGWKSTHAFADVVREELAKYPYLLSVPIQKSPDYEDGLLAYGYSILLDHVEKQNPGCVGNALHSLKPGVATPVGEQLYAYIVTEGRLRESYPDFVKNALLAAVPDPGLWFQFRILESKEDTRIFQRPSGRLGDTELSGQRLASDNQRYAEHKFKMTLPALTLRCVQISADSIREARGVGVKLASDGMPSDSGWIAAVPAGAKGKTEAKRVTEEGTHVPGVGKAFASVWIAVFNPDPASDRRYELSVFLRKDTKSPFRVR